MKNITFKLLLIAFGLSLLQTVSAQVFITGFSDSIASLNTPFGANVEYIDVPGGDPTNFELLEAPAGMSINSSGVITWTPTDIDQGGLVTVRGWDSNGEDTKSFHVYITDEIVCSPDLVSYWNMNNIISNSVADDAGGYDAVLNGNTAPTVSSDGVVGNSLRFVPDDILDEFMQAPEDDQYDPLHDDDFSISLWFKRIPTLISPAQTVETILAKSSSIGPYPNGARWEIYYADDNYIHFKIQDNSTDGFSFSKKKTITDTNWHHVVVTANLVRTPYDTLNSQFQIFVDGEVTAPTDSGFYNFSTENFAGNDGISFGAFTDGGSNKHPFSGNLDEVAYYDKKLSNSEVSDLYNKGLAGEPICQAGNIAPIITSTAVTSVDEDSPYAYDLDYMEIDGDPVTLGITVKPSWLNFNASTGELTGMPLNENVGDTTVTLTVSDGTVTIEETFTITVNNTNDDPVIQTVAPKTVYEDSLYTYTFEATDVDLGDNVTLSAPVLPAWLNFEPSTGVLSETPTNDQVLLEASVDYDVTLRAADDNGGIAEEVFKITVYNVNDLPVIDTKNPLAVDEDNDITIDFTALEVTDVDNTYPDDFALAVKAGSNYSFTGNVVTPDENWNGTLTVPIDLSDGEDTISTDLTVTVNAVNDAPEFTSDPVENALVGTQYQYWITADDVEGSALTITAPTYPSDWLTFSANGASGLLQGTPALADVAMDTVILHVSDGDSVRIQMFVIDIAADNYPPEFASETESLTATPEVVFTYTASATDQDGDALTYSAPALSPTSWLSFDAGTQLLSGIPAASDAGVHNVVIEVTDGLATDEIALTITVGPDAIRGSNMDIAQVYPVPADNTVTFEFGTTLTNVSIKIYSLTGSMLIEEQFESQSEVDINISDLNAGQYLYVIENTEGFQRGTLIKK